MTERRCHYATFIINTLKTIWAVLALLIAIVLQNSGSAEMLSEISGYRLWLLIALAAFIIIALAWHFIRWRRTFVSLDGESLIINRRTLNSSHIVVKLATVASVNISQGVWEKLFGVYRLQLDINSSATADKRGFDLLFERDAAWELRALILAGSAAAENSKAAAEDDRELVCEFSFPQVARHCLLSLSFISIIGAATGVVLWLLSSEAGEEARISWMPIAVVFVPAVYQLLRPLFRYYHFRVIRQGKRLHISYGLVATRHFSLPLDKTNGIIIRRPLLARLFNLCCGEIINIGMGDAEENQAPLFCLLTTPQQMHRIIEAVAPDYAEAAQPGSSSPLRRSPSAALLPLLPKWLCLSAVSGVAAALLWQWWIGVLIALFWLLCCMASWRTKELALLERQVSISNGIFSQRNITIDYGRLQTLSRYSSPLSRRYGLMRGAVTILSSSVNRSNAIGYFPADDFERIEAAIMRSAAEKIRVPAPENAE